uniref:EF-hand domain-containing protein n=1 Tax=Aplanochytrium stocchinoi TaxID=215587 RepID=A0A7S3PDG4_9STRA|mmetsp:Transcript_6201/g.7547  ORF Transcript_6201/g.7547 Transcript_6201/m.7547 type:complete len:276 (-) Transcript_6201:1170-1997(-)
MTQSKDGTITLTDGRKDKLISAGGQLSFGAFSGLISGYALRQGGKVVGLLAGTGFMFLQSLAYMGYIEVDWRKVERSYKLFLDKDGDEEVTMKDFKMLFNDTNEMLKFNLPSGAGFTGGLAYGLTGSLRATALAPIAYTGAISAVLGEIPFDILDECEKLGIKTPRDMMANAPSMESLQNSIASMDTLQKLGSRIGGMIKKPADPQVKYQPFLKSLGLQELRDLEANIKHSSQKTEEIPQLKLLGYGGDDKEILLDQIENQKRIIKGRYFVFRFR